MRPIALAISSVVFIVPPSRIVVWWPTVVFSVVPAQKPLPVLSTSPLPFDSVHPLSSRQKYRFNLRYDWVLVLHGDRVNKIIAISLDPSPAFKLWSEQNWLVSFAPWKLAFRYGTGVTVYEGHFVCS